MTTICDECIYKRHQSGSSYSGYFCVHTPLKNQIQDLVTGEIQQEYPLCKDKNKGNCPDFEERSGFWYRLFGI